MRTSPGLCAAAIVAATLFTISPAVASCGTPPTDGNVELIDDAGLIRVVVPALWSDVTTTPVVLGDGLLHPVIAASSDLDGFFHNWASGVLFYTAGLWPTHRPRSMHSASTSAAPPWTSTTTTRAHADFRLVLDDFASDGISGLTFSENSLAATGSARTLEIVGDPTSERAADVVITGPSGDTVATVVGVTPGTACSVAVELPVGTSVITTSVTADSDVEWPMTPADVPASARWVDCSVHGQPADLNDLTLSASTDNTRPATVTVSRDGEPVMVFSDIAPGSMCTESQYLPTGTYQITSDLTGDLDAQFEVVGGGVS